MFKKRWEKIFTFLSTDPVNGIFSGPFFWLIVRIGG